MKKLGKLLLEYGIMSIGGILYSIGISMFLDPNNLAPGGVTGIGIILSNFLPVETGTIVFIINVPLLLIGFWKLGYKLIWRTFYCILFTSSLIDSINTNYGRALTDDKIISAIAGAGLVAVGVGLIMKQGGTTGGSDIVVKLLRRRFPHIKTNVLFFAIDFVIVAASAVAFQDIVVALYALVAVGVSSYVLDKVLYGTDEAKLIYIISDCSQPIADKLLNDLGVGATFIQGKGAFSGKNKAIIMVVVRKTLSPKVEEIVKEVDSTAFMIVTSANEIYGEGYKNIFSEKL